ncbi:hypothetical protein XBO1_770003 [Xenorhabdus bovienii str. oregonense]|uniref:Uncharacterized protein n=1 Tax=Xenorhabdus bovienii str. oregonense TaxID=1398202 RepID=A0A077PAS0_XENBV|nr:hypothetical protein XBO1_770003 [Xenorhabdus bovienii str. oregonense]
MRAPFGCLQYSPPCKLVIQTISLSLLALKKYLGIYINTKVFRKQVY